MAENLHVRRLVPQPRDPQLRITLHQPHKLVAVRLRILTNQSCSSLAFVVPRSVPSSASKLELAGGIGTVGRNAQRILPPFGRLRCGLSSVFDRLECAREAAFMPLSSDETARSNQLANLRPDAAQTHGFWSETKLKPQSLALRRSRVSGDAHDV
jgi:hypothetical protein